MNKVFKGNILVLMITVMIIFYGFISKIISVSDTILSFIIQFGVIFCIPIFVFIVYTKVDIKQTFKLNKINLKQVALVSIFSICLIPLAAILSAISNIFVELPLESTKPLYPLWLLIISNALIPAVFEELTFRGIFLSNYDEVNTRKVAILNGLLFGLIHLNITQFAYAFMFGYAFVYLVRVTKSIYATILAHFLINAINIVLDRYVFSTITDNNAGYALLLLIIFPIIGTYVSRSIYKKLKDMNKEDGEIKLYKGLQIKEMIPYYISIVILLLLTFT